MATVPPNQIVSVNSEGTPCFSGTQVPVRLLLNRLEKGYTIYEFLITFPTVRRQQVMALLEAASRMIDLYPETGKNFR